MACRTPIGARGIVRDLRKRRSPRVEIVGIEERRGIAHDLG
jgi:hypothetical protein